MKINAPSKGLQIDGSSEILGALDVSKSVVSLAAAHRAVSATAVSFAGGKLGSLVSGKSGSMLSNLLSGGLSADTLAGLVDVGMSAETLGNLVAAGISAPKLADLHELVTPSEIEALKVMLADVESAKSLGNVINSGMNVDTLLALFDANINFESINNAIPNTTAASRLGDLISAGLDSTTISSILTSGLDTTALQDLVGGVLDDVTKDWLVGAGISLTDLNELISSGLDASFLIDMLEGGAESVTQLLDLGLDKLGDMLKAGLDGSFLIELLGNAKSAIETLLSSNLADDLGDLLEAGLDIAALTAIVSLPLATIEALSENTHSAADSLRQLVATPEGAALLESMVAGADATDSVTVNGSPVLTEATIPSANLSVHLTGDVIAYGRVEVKPGNNASLILDTSISGALSNSAVVSFNGRSGAVALTNTDVTTALGYVPISASHVIANAVYANTAGNATNLGGQNGSYYLNLTNATGTLASARLSGTYTIDISGNAATATTAATATSALSAGNAVFANTAGYTNTANTANYAGQLNTAKIISLVGAVTGNVAFDGSSNVSITTVAANSITANNTAYFGGQLPSFYANSTHTHTFASLTSKPTTVSGYGITDAMLNTGGTFTGSVTVSNTAGATLTLNGNAATERNIIFRTNSVTRWNFRASGSAESGSNNGSNLELLRYSDAGAYLGQPIAIRRFDGRTTFETTPYVATNQLWHAGNDGPGSTLDADLLDGQQGVFYQNANNLTTGTIPDARLPTGTAKLARETYVASRTQNLITNGTGLLGNNSNFSGFTFDGTDAYYATGSFTNSQYTMTLYNDEAIPIDPTQTYEMSLFAKGNPYVGASHILGLALLDADGLVIGAQHHMYGTSSTTTLTAALNPGDTTVQVASAAGMQGGSAGSHQRGFIVWNYVNSFGFAYGPETYSRNYYPDLWDTDAAINTTTNVITLKAPWAGPAIPSGTSLSRSNSGAASKYIIGGGVAPATWTRYAGRISGVDLSGTNVVDKFAPGTAAVKMIFLLNRNFTGGKTWLSNIKFGLYSGEYTVSSAGVVDYTSTPKVGGNAVWHDTGLPVNAWQRSTTDNANRFQFVSSGATYFGALAGYAWRSSTNSDIMTLSNAGALAIAGDITTYSSDARLKTNVATITDPLAKLAQIGGYTFDWDRDMANSAGFTPHQYTNEHGVLAQEIMQVVPDAVRLAAFNEEYLTVKYERLVPLLIEGVKELARENEYLKNAISRMQAQLNILEHRGSV